MAIRIDHERSTLFCDKRCGYERELSQSAIRSGLRMLEAAETAQSKHRCGQRKASPRAIPSPTSDRWRELFKDIDLSEVARSA